MITEDLTYTQTKVFESTFGHHKCKKSPGITNRTVSNNEKVFTSNLISLMIRHLVDTDKTFTGTNKSISKCSQKIESLLQNLFDIQESYRPPISSDTIPKITLGLQFIKIAHEICFKK
jgi:hypothetical protein